MPAREPADLESLSDLCTPWCIRVVATLRIADHIAAGTTEVNRLALLAGCDPELLGRVLRHLVSKGVFEENARARFVLNDAARGLLEPGQRLGFDLDGIGGRMAGAWGTLLSLVRTGRPAYRELFGRTVLGRSRCQPRDRRELRRAHGAGRTRYAQSGVRYHWWLGAGADGGRCRRGNGCNAGRDASRPSAMFTARWSISQERQVAPTRPFAPPASPSA